MFWLFGLISWFCVVFGKFLGDCYIHAYVLTCCNEGIMGRVSIWRVSGKVLCSEATRISGPFYCLTFCSSVVGALVWKPSGPGKNTGGFIQSQLLQGITHQAAANHNNFMIYILIREVSKLLSILVTPTIFLFNWISLGYY